MNNLNYQFVASDAQLAALCETCSNSEVVALDTEFFREDTYYPIPALLQLYDGDNIYLIDPLAINNFSPLAELLQNPSVVKVVHSCSEDLEVFRCLCDTLPTPLFDTQIAAGYCGIGFSVSYQKLVDQLLGQTISKAETRSNWLRRPLTDNQCQYAAHDVRWLLGVYQSLLNKLIEQQRVSWLQDDVDRLIANASKPPADELNYLRVKAASRLDRQQLNLLRALCIWREQKARSEDVPKGRVVNDAALVAVSQLLSAKSPLDKISLAKIESLTRAQVRRFGDDILAIAEKSASQHTDTYPLSLRNENLKQQRQAIKVMQGIARDVASRIGLPVELLARKKEIEAYLLSPAQSLIKTSWRKPLLADLFDDARAAIYTVNSEK